MTTFDVEQPVSGFKMYPTNHFTDDSPGNRSGETNRRCHNQFNELHPRYYGNVRKAHRSNLDCLVSNGRVTYLIQDIVWHTGHTLLRVYWDTARKRSCHRAKFDEIIEVKIPDAEMSDWGWFIYDATRRLTSTADDPTSIWIEDADGDTVTTTLPRSVALRPTTLALCWVHNNDGFRFYKFLYPSELEAYKDDGA